MTRNLLTDPCWRADDLGAPLPDSPHATSVALPCWDHVVGYEEGRPEIVESLQLGYPRFVLHPQVAELFATLENRLGQPGERCFAFPSEKVAERCAHFLAVRGWEGVRQCPWESSGVHAVFFPEAAFRDAKAFWQHFGKVISSRRAEAALSHRPAPAHGLAARETVRQRIAALTGVDAAGVWLFPSGMAAVSRALHMAQERRPEARSIQLGFPYVDVFKIQTVEGPGNYFVPDYNLDEVRSLLERGPVSSIVCEFPGNPLLHGCDLVDLAALARKHEVPLIVDDTAATCVNIQPFPHADIIVTSLTKAFSGVGDVMAGALALNPGSAFNVPFQMHMARHFEDLLWAEDAVVLEHNSRVFEERVRAMNATAEQLCDWLAAQPAVDRVYYPKFTIRAAYDRIRRADGGYGGLFSLLLKHPEASAPIFYDRLRISKGPSLGNDFSMACPYTLLAHFDELEWAESHGVSRWLVRVSIGLEPTDDLIARFAEALDGLPA
ncbi:MAG: PLP-dependent transferase [Candidatus Hydrogenedentes bacterium]|nr:PLP-dependent transferase [Candidatus Hydrogenedentota bacterium]